MIRGAKFLNFFVFVCAMSYARKNATAFKIVNVEAKKIRSSKFSEKLMLVLREQIMIEIKMNER